MGYSTKFAGELKFSREASATELLFVKSLFWIEEAEIKSRSLLNTKGALSYVQFELTDDWTGIKWDGSEKFYNAVEAVNFIQENLAAKYSDLRLTGSLQAQGEEFDDRWVLSIGPDGWAQEVRIPFTGKKATCPDCGCTFAVET